jgi:O-antigen ligase
VLWEELWKRGTDALPFGQGWGYIPTLSSNEIFGYEAFSSGGIPFVFPHNDFLYLFVELGLVGLGLLIAYWFSFLRKVRLLSRSPSEPVRYGVRILVPVAIVMLLVQLFDNGFAIRFVAERSFIVMGLVFGLHHFARHNDLLVVADSSSRLVRGSFVGVDR